MNPPNFEVVGAGNPASMPLALLRRPIEKPTIELGEIRPIGRIRFLFHNEDVCAAMVLPCEWLWQVSLAVWRLFEILIQARSPAMGSYCAWLTGAYLWRSLMLRWVV